MRHRDWWYLTLILVAITVAVSFAASAQTTPYPSRESNEGQVLVTVTPLTLSGTADDWRFEVRLVANGKKARRAHRRHAKTYRYLQCEAPRRPV
jgi:hypothetical protein